MVDRCAAGPDSVLHYTSIILLSRFLLTLGIFLGTSIFHWFNLMPLVPNHVFFELIVHLTLVAAIAPSLFRRINGKLRGSTKTRHSSISEEIFTSVRPYIRLELIILYLFTVLHKLNFDFFDPETSCGFDARRRCCSFTGNPNGTMDSLAHHHWNNTYRNHHTSAVSNEGD